MHSRCRDMKKLLTAGSAFVATFIAAAPAFAQGQAVINPCPNDAGQGFGSLCRLTPQSSLPFLFTWIIIIAIVLALIFLIWGGIRWILSGGDKAKVESARSTIIAAIVGLIIIFLSWFIISIITQIFFGRSLFQNFVLPTIS